MNNLHVQIKARIFQAGVTQEQVARVMDIEPSLFSRILRGTRPTPDDFEEKVDAAIELLLRAEQAAIEARQRVLQEAD